VSPRGLSEAQARAFLERELGRMASPTSFYWESEELEELLDMLVDAIAELIARNNAQLIQELEREARQARARM
jgi:hypothetical protein